MRLSITVLTLMFVAVPVPATSAPSAGQVTTVHPGDTLVNPERLLPHRATWRVTQHDPDGGSTVQGLWTDTWVRAREDGRFIVVFRQLFVDTSGAVLVDNETVFDAATFRGIRSTQHLPPTGARVTYRYVGDTVSGTLRRSSAAEAVELQVVFQEPVWEPLAPVSVLLPLERLGSGAVIRYPVWNQVGPGSDVTWSEMRVDSAGHPVAPAGRMVEVWHLTATLAAAPNTVTQLLQSPGPPYYWWFAITRPGQRREWTLVDWEPSVSPDAPPNRSPW